MEEGSELTQHPHESQRVETPDGKEVYLFRYENQTQQNKNPNSNVSQDDLVGAWFTDSLTGLKDYIKKKQPGGVIRVLKMPKESIDALKAINHPVAKNMDIEPLDNYIIPEELRKTAQDFPLPVTPKNPNKFLFGDWQIINKAVDGLVAQLRANGQAPQS